MALLKRREINKEAMAGIIYIAIGSRAAEWLNTLAIRGGFNINFCNGMRLKIPVQRLHLMQIPACIPNQMQ